METKPIQTFVFEQNLKPEDATAIEHESFRSAQQPQANLDKKKKNFFF